MILGEKELPYVKGMRALPATKHYVKCQSAMTRLSEHFSPIFKVKNWHFLKNSATGLTFADRRGSSVSIRVNRGQVRVEVSSWNPTTFTAKSDVMNSSSFDELLAWLAPKVDQFPTVAPAVPKAKKSNSPWRGYRPEAIAA